MRFGNKVRPVFHSVTRDERVSADTPEPCDPRAWRCRD
jgi:hypothetical protein